MGLIKKIKCRHCGLLFVPDPKNRDRQKYCPNPACRKASKAASQQKWLAKPENRDYFKGPVNVARVREWRKKHPGYWKHKKPGNTLKDSLNIKPTENTKHNDQFTGLALQDLLMRQPAVIIGLISNFIGSPLQDDIALTLYRMQQSGKDILYNHSKAKGGSNDLKISDCERAFAQGP